MPGSVINSSSTPVIFNSSCNVRLGRLGKWRQSKLFPRNVVCKIPQKRPIIVVHRDSVKIVPVSKRTHLAQHPNFLCSCMLVVREMLVEQFVVKSLFRWQSSLLEFRLVGHVIVKITAFLIVFLRITKIVARMEKLIWSQLLHDPDKVIEWQSEKLTRVGRHQVADSRW